MTPTATLSIARASGAAVPGPRPALYGDRDVARVLAVTAALAGATDPAAVARAAVDGLRDVLGGRSASLNVLAGDAIHTLVTSGAGQPAPGRHSVTGARARQWAGVLADWDHDARRPVVLPGASLAGITSGDAPAPFGTTLALVPFGPNDGPTSGFVAVDRAGGAPRTDQLALAASLAEHVRVALDRTSGGADEARRARHLDLLYDVPRLMLATDGLQGLLEALAPGVRAAAAAELLDAYLCDARAARLFATPAPRGALSRSLAAWRRRPPAGPVMAGDLLVVPMVVSGDLVGILRARPAQVGFGAADERLLGAIATLVGCAVTRVLLRDRLDGHAARLAVAEACQESIRGLHVTARERLGSAAAELSALAVPGGGPAGLSAGQAVLARGAVAGADAELRQASHALDYARLAERGLPASVRALARAARGADLHATARVSGTPRPLSPARAESLYRVACEGISHARAGRAATVVLRLAYHADDVTLAVRDDGTGLGRRAELVPDLMVSLRALRRRLDDTGGTLSIANASPRGITVTARTAAP